MNKHLPSIYSVVGPINIGQQGKVFRDFKSAQDWLSRTIATGVAKGRKEPEGFEVVVTEVIYYACADDTFFS